MVVLDRVNDGDYSHVTASKPVLIRVFPPERGNTTLLLQGFRICP